MRQHAKALLQAQLFAKQIAEQEPEETRKLNYLKKQKESASLIVKKNRASNRKKVIVTPETNVFSVTAPIQVNTKLKLPALPSIQDTLKGYNSDL